jgi:hypothetical protein
MHAGTVSSVAENGAATSRPPAGKASAMVSGVAGAGPHQFPTRISVVTVAPPARLCGAAGDDPALGCAEGDGVPVVAASIRIAPFASTSWGRTTAGSRQGVVPGFLTSTWAIQLPATPSQRAIRPLNAAASHAVGPALGAADGEGLDADGEADAVEAAVVGGGGEPVAVGAGVEADAHPATKRSRTAAGASRRVMRRARSSR